MRIFLAAPDDAYTRVNFIQQFARLGHEVVHFDFTKRSLEWLRGVDFGPTDLLFHILVNDELPLDVVKALPVRTLMWASDDDWRLPLSLSRVGAYDFATTNDPNALPLYRAQGHTHVRHVQYGVNTEAWQAQPFDWGGADLADYASDYVETPYDVTFIGQAYLGRPQFIRGLAERGIKVHVWGQGFSGEPLSHERMIQTLCGSKIVLGLNWMAGGPKAGYGAQIKGRLFEASALGCFQLVNADYRLARYFAPGEIATYASLDDCAAQIRHFLAHPAERRAIAKAGQARTLTSHTWERRWADLFAELEASCPA